MTPSEQPRMTASEKLERLDGAITDLTPFADGRFVSAITIKEPAAQSLVALRNALPELIAVVRAAEQIAEARSDVAPFPYMTARAALTALERKLGAVK